MVGHAGAAQRVRAILGKLHATLVRVLAQADLREQFARQGADAVTNQPAEFGKFKREEWDRFGKAIKAAKLAVD